MNLRGIGTWKNADKALTWLEKSAVSGHAPAQNELGKIYSEGREVARSFDEARRWFQAAADLDYAPAQFNLGLLYTYSPEGGNNPAAAIICFEQAVKQGHALAAWYLGSAYEEGRGVAQDLATACAYYLISRDRGCSRAAEALERAEKKRRKS